MAAFMTTPSWAPEPAPPIQFNRRPSASTISSGGRSPKGMDATPSMSDRSRPASAIAASAASSARSSPPRARSRPVSESPRPETITRRFEFLRHVLCAPVTPAPGARRPRCSSSAGRTSSDPPRRGGGLEGRARVDEGPAEVVVVDLDREATGNEVRVAEDLLGGIQHGRRNAPPLRLEEERLAGEVLGDEPQGVRARLVDRRRLRIRRDRRDEDAPTLHPHLQEEGVLELVTEAQLHDPFAHRAEFARPSWQGADHRASVRRSHEPRRGLPDRRVPEGLPLHGRLGDEPFVGRRLGRHIACRVHAHVDMLSRPCVSARRSATMVASTAHRHAV